MLLDDLSRLIDGQDLVVAQAAGAEDNVAEFFSTHPSVQQMIFESEPASSGAGVYVVATEIRTIQRQHIVCFGTQFFPAALHPGNSVHDSIMEQALSAGRYIDFSVLVGRHYAEFIIDLWERFVYFLDGRTEVSSRAEVQSIGDQVCILRVSLSGTVAPLIVALLRMHD